MLAAMHNQNLAHGRAVQALRAVNRGPRVGTVMSATSCCRSSAGQRARPLTSVLTRWNGACLDPLLRGGYPAPVAADFARLTADGDLAIIQQPLDFVGVNYYAPMYVTDAPQSLFGAWFGATLAGTRFTE